MWGGGRKGSTEAIERIGDIDSCPISIGCLAWQLVSRIIPKLVDLHTTRGAALSFFLFFSFAIGRSESPSGIG